MKVGDIITISIDNIPADYTVVRSILPNYFVIKEDVNLPNSILIEENNGTFEIVDYNRPYTLTPYRTSSLGDFFNTNLPYRDLGRTILMNLPEEDLDKMCDPNNFRGANELCNEGFYRMRLEKFFPGAEEFLSKDRSYKDFYKNLYNINFDTKKTLKTIVKTKGLYTGDKDANIRILLREYAYKNDLDVLKYMYALGLTMGELYVPSEVAHAINPDVFEWLFQLDKLNKNLSILSLKPVMLLKDAESGRNKDGALYILNRYFEMGKYPGSSVTKYRQSSDPDVAKWINDHFDFTTARRPKPIKLITQE